MNGQNLVIRFTQKKRERKEKETQCALIQGVNTAYSGYDEPPVWLQTCSDSREPSHPKSGEHAANDNTGRSERIAASTSVPSPTRKQ